MTTPLRAIRSYLLVITLAALWPARAISSDAEVPASIVARSHAMVSSALATRAGIVNCVQALSAQFQG
jgi:hypothetical protein